MSLVLFLKATKMAVRNCNYETDERGRGERERKTGRVGE